MTNLADTHLTSAERATCSSRFSQAALCAFALTLIMAVSSVAQVDGISREQMWPAPTAADWAKPCLITWQRTYDDAVALSQKTGRSILLCINMDGEIASEHYAGIRYRQPEIAALYKPYINVIASVYRHTPRDHDEEGHRILCPRFGGVTCGEHIAIEPILYEKFLDGQRIAPRHIMVELDGSETYDVFHAFDTDSVFKAIREGGERIEKRDLPKVRGDQTIVERVTSTDSGDRNAVEAAYINGDRALRRKILEKALAANAPAPVGLLRLALFGFDEELANTARQILANATSVDAIDLIAEALRVAMPKAQRDELVAAMERLGGKSADARTLAAVHRGLSTGSAVIDVKKWSAVIDPTATPSMDYSEAAARISQVDHAFEKKDAAAHVGVAQAFLLRAVDGFADPVVSTRQAEALLGDALASANEAKKLGAKGYGVNSVLAVIAYLNDDPTEARKLSVLAMKDIPDEASDWNSMIVLGLFAEQRRSAIRGALTRRKSWPREWLADLHAAHTILIKHPHGTVSQATTYHDFLLSLRAWRKASTILNAAIDRFPDSSPLHDRLRAAVIQRDGVNGLEAEYKRRLASNDASVNLPWFAGYASIVTAEFHHRSRRLKAAMNAYDRAIAHYEDCIRANADTRPTSDHYVAMALGGKARTAFEQQDLKTSLSCVLASFKRKASSAASLDGLNLSTVDTAKMLLSKLKTSNHPTMASRLKKALDQLNPKLLELPAYEGPRPDRKR